MTRFAPTKGSHILAKMVLFFYTCINNFHILCKNHLTQKKYQPFNFLLNPTTPKNLSTVPDLQDLCTLAFVLKDHPSYASKNKTQFACIVNNLHPLLHEEPAREIVNNTSPSIAGHPSHETMQLHQQAICLAQCLLFIYLTCYCVF